MTFFRLFPVKLSQWGHLKGLSVNFFGFTIFFTFWKFANSEMKISKPISSLLLVSEDFKLKLLFIFRKIPICLHRLSNFKSRSQLTNFSKNTKKSTFISHKKGTKQWSQQISSHNFVIGESTFAVKCKIPMLICISGVTFDHFKSVSASELSDRHTKSWARIL